MPAEYLLRFDDLCPTMNWPIWERIEALLVTHRIKPILAVIPDNRDPELAVHPPDPNFWNRVRAWQALGWTIGVHGYEHRYVTADAGILGKNAYSEFAGLPAAVQEEKLRLAVKIFEEQGVRPELFVAPAHSFDKGTLAGLLRCGITALSDGYALYPARDKSGMFWVPQQLSTFEYRPLGAWTICMHPNMWGPGQLPEFEEGLKDFGPRFTTFPSLRRKYQSRTFSGPDVVHAAAYTLRLRAGKSARSLLGLTRRPAYHL